MKEFRVTPQDDRIPDPRISLADERSSVTRDNTLLGDVRALIVVPDSRQVQYEAIRDRSYLYDETYEEATQKMEVIIGRRQPPTEPPQRPKRRR